jgi:hypothetical protein
MMLDRAMPTAAGSALIRSSFGTLPHHRRLSPNWHRPALWTAGPSFQAPALELIQSTRISSFCAPFPGSKMRRDSTSPREVPRGSLSRSFPACSLRMSGMLWEATPLQGFSQLQVLSNRSLALQESPWLINQNPEPSNSPSIFLLIPGCVLNPFTNRWDLRRKRRPSRPFSISCRPRTKSIPLPSSAWKRKSITRFISSNP